MRAIPQAPLRSRTVGFPQSGSDLGFPLRGLPCRSDAQVLAHVHPAYAGLPTNSSPLRGSVSLGSESENHPGTAKCPEPLRPMPVLPTRGRHQVPPGRALPLRHHSYGLMRQTVALLSPLASPRARGLGRLLPAPAAQRSFPTLSLPIFPHVSGPLLRLPPGCTCPFLPPELWPSPSLKRVGALAISEQLLQFGQ